MAFADKLKDILKQGEGALAANKDKAHEAVNKVADQADKRTQGKYSEQIRNAEQKAGEAVDKIAERGAGGPADQGEGGPAA
jgi:MT0933-like antitoxin protein